jgi:hypothetical protein
MIRGSRDGEGHVVPTLVKILLAALAVIALLQVPTLVSWWSGSCVAPHCDRSGSIRWAST